MYRFWRCDLKLPIHAAFGGVFEAYFPHMTSSIAVTPEGLSLGGNTSFEPFTVRIGATVRPGRVTEKKNTEQQNNHKSVIFPLFGGKPPLDRFDPKVVWWVTSMM